LLAVDGYCRRLPPYILSDSLFSLCGAGRGFTHVSQDNDKKFGLFMLSCFTACVEHVQHQLGCINYVSIKPIPTVTRTQYTGRLKLTMETELRRQKRTVCKRVRTITLAKTQHQFNSNDCRRAKNHGFYSTILQRSSYLSISLPVSPQL
jgi:hypothetical protein